MSEEKKLKIEKVDIAEGGRYGKFCMRTIRPWLWDHSR